MQNWKKRYFVLEHGTLVYYTDASLRRRKGVINVYGAAVRPVCCLGLAGARRH